MVDVGAKSETRREATAECFVRMAPDTVRAVREAALAKGDALGVARVAGIMGAKRTPDLIPLCHPLPPSSVEGDLEVHDDGIRVDAQQRIAAFVGAAADGHALVVTTGGTGLGPRDVTPQATRPLLDYEVPGLAELMRAEAMRRTPAAALSRSLAGVRGRTLILNLPGSVRGATESLEAVVPALRHALGLLSGDTAHPRS